MNKQELRKELIWKRKNIEKKKEKSTIIVDKIKDLDLYQKSNVIAFYKSMPDEVCVDLLINDALQKHKIVLLPKVVDNNLVFVIVSEKTEYEKSNFGVIEPIINHNIYNGKIDLIIVPGVGFDTKNNRLGFGKGYYDRYLNKKSIYKIGVCFQEQIVSELPINDLDISMNLIITN